MLNQSNSHSTYKCLDKIGQGTFGAVFKCLNITNGKQGALKKIYIIEDINSLKRLLREILLLKYLKYEHLICLKDGYLGYDNKGSYIIFITELMHMNLRDLIFKTDFLVTHRQIKYYLYQIFLALAYLHMNDIVHRDIKPDNILVNTDNEIRVGDFGWARHITSSQNLTKIIANIHYRAPEICLRNESHDSKVDIWAVGCLFYEMIMKNFLFNEKKDTHLLATIFQKFGTLTEHEIWFIERPDAQKWVLRHDPIAKKRPSDYLVGFDDAHGKDLFDQCLQINPNQRISAFDALKHPYFEDIYDQNEIMNGMVNHSNQINFSFESNPNLNNAQLKKRISEEIQSIPPWG